MPDRQNECYYGASVENAVAWRCYVHKINAKFHNFLKLGLVGVNRGDVVTKDQSMTSFRISDFYL
jgi:hypothetical protein